MSRRSFPLCLLLLVLASPDRAHAQDVLVIYDTLGGDTADLVAALQSAGFTVTYSDTAETGYDGTNPSPWGFDAVIHLNGETHEDGMDAAGQDELVDYTRNGGGYIGMEWSAYEVDLGRMPAMYDLILFERLGGATGNIVVSDFPGQENHPVLAHAPSPFAFNAGYNEGYLRVFGAEEPELLMTDGAGNAAVAIREWGSGRIVGFHHAGNYDHNLYHTLAHTEVQELFVGAVEWVAAAGCLDDADGDGYYDQACGGDDCNDADPAINPGAVEIGCNGLDENCDGWSDPGTDADGDGVDTCSGDCDDSNAAVYPGAYEAPCDHVDNDCDGVLNPLEADADADGWSLCQGDCDDADATANPGAVEVACDGVDNDCDGVPHPDEADGDGDGESPCDGDCDDADPARYSGAAEVCDSIDNDCDGSVDEWAIDGTSWYQDDDGDGYGTLATAIVDCDQPPGFVSLSGDCDDANPFIFPGATEARDTVDNDCDGFFDEGTFPLNALVITEVMQNPDAVLDDDGEWFEIYNGTATHMNLVGLVVTDLGANEFTVETDLWVSPYSYAVFAGEDDPGVNGGVTVDYVWDTFNLANADDEIYLDHAGDLLDGIEWDGGILWPDPAGASMSLDPTAYATDLNDDAAHWCESFTAFGLGDLGTPGAENTTCCPDADGDGHRDDACGGDDCDDTDATIHPDAPEICDGLDNDCSALTPENVDVDSDGYTACDGDCAEGDPLRNPGWEEVCDGFDNDCDETTDELADSDGDGFTICDDDCDDAVDTVYPGAPEICDGYDSDCDGSMGQDEEDDDEDGVLVCEGDCDDDASETYPGAPEQCDNEDNDCDGDVDEDADEDLDGDGFNACQGDCDNEYAYTYPGAPEICDGEDNNCDGYLPDEEADEDGDGLNECDGDCADNDPALNLSDEDGDGITSCDGDCDDLDPDTYPGAEELCDGLDNDCDGTGDDQDGDGYDPIECGGEDCDDTNALIRPGAGEACSDGVDNDCDGDIDAEDSVCEGGGDEPETGGCGCRTTGSPGAPAALSLLALLLLAAHRRRRPVA